MEQLEKIAEALQKGKAREVKELVQAALDEGLSPEDILNQGLLAGMNVIGIQFKNNEIYVPDVLIAARAMKAGTEILKPLLVAGGIKAKGRVVIGTVRGDLHDIGKNLVAMMMEGQGLEIVDAGTDVPPERFIELAVEHNARIIACSALLTTTMNEMKYVVQAARDAGIREQVVIMVGGAPVTDAFARSIGADLYTPDAASAAEEAVKALEKN
jgi:corrinoid protein of di/trimethylamine methyltransferase